MKFLLGYSDIFITCCNSYYTKHFFILKVKFSQYFFYPSHKISHMHKRFVSKIFIQSSCSFDLYIAMTFRIGVCKPVPKSTRPTDANIPASPLPLTDGANAGDWNAKGNPTPVRCSRRSCKSLTNGCRTKPI